MGIGCVAQLGCILLFNALTVVFNRYMQRALPDHIALAYLSCTYLLLAYIACFPVICSCLEKQRTQASA